MIKAKNCNCQCDCSTTKKTAEKELVITWQRLVTDGSTCPRCGSTEDELDKAVLQLREKLNPVGIKVILEKKELSLEEFEKAPIQSNQILLNGKLLEHLIDAKIGSSKCCDVCGDNECRTIEKNGESREVITEDLIVNAGLLVTRKNNNQSCC